MSRRPHSATPRDLATATRRELAKRGAQLPPLEVLERLFEAMYFTSLRTEEAEPIAFHVVFLNPANPDPSPPQRIVRDRWTCVRFPAQLPFNVEDLAKLAKASDPRSSSLAVYYTAQRKLFVWGLVDQGHHYHEFVTYETESGPERPGLFQASILGTAHVSVFIQYEKIAELKLNRLLGHAKDVLRFGPVRDQLDEAIDAHIHRVESSVGTAVFAQNRWWKASLASDWVAALCRLLLRIQNYRHGGAILLVERPAKRGLNIKYPLDYPRLRTALDSRAVSQIFKYAAWTDIFGNYLDQGAIDIPASLYLDETVNDNDVGESRSELDGTLWFVSLLSRIDGLVLMTKGFEVLGFGVEITTVKEPGEILLANDERGSDRRATPVTYTHYGTRHRSMMRYCAANPRSLGFVISQDGDVRVMTMLGGKLFMWDDIELKLHDFMYHQRRTVGMAP